MKWRIRTHPLGDTLTRSVFPYQVMHSMEDYDTDTELLQFCRETFGLGCFSTIMGTGYWEWNRDARWIHQRDFFAFRSHADMLVFLMRVA